MVEYLGVFHHVGFFVFPCCGPAATARREPRIISQGGPSMHIGGGWMTLMVDIQGIEVGFRTLFSGVMSCAYVI